MQKIYNLDCNDLSLYNDCEQIIHLEEFFSASHYNGCGEEKFIIEEGTIPIIVSAPHAVNHFRNGYIKSADVLTGGIARFLHCKTGCHIIYSSKYSKSDPNYDLPDSNPYQTSLLEYIIKHDIVFLLDLHGAAKTREYALEIGFSSSQPSFIQNTVKDNNPIRQNDYISIIKSVFHSFLSNSIIAEKNIWKQNTVTKYISYNARIACLQLEINRKYREPEKVYDFMSFVYGLLTAINECKKIAENKSV